MLALTITGAAQLTLCLRRQQHTACVGLGVFHTGCEVYGKEYAFGGHQHASSGVFESQVAINQETYGPDIAKLIKTLTLPYTLKGELGAELMNEPFELKGEIKLNVSK